MTRLDRSAWESGHKEIDDEIEGMLDAIEQKRREWRKVASVVELIADLVEAAKEAGRWDGVDDGGHTYRVIERDREALDEARWALACAIARDLELRGTMPRGAAHSP